MNRQGMREFTYKLRVPWSDTDAAGVVHFANYFKYFERAELELYRALGFAYTKSLVSRGLWFARVEAHCKYLSPCEFDDEIEVRLKLEKLGNSSIKFAMEIFNHTSRTQAAEGHMVIVSAKKDDRKSLPLPSDFKKALQKYFAK
jgi:acyl-CoA thioester hydrolase